MKKKKILIIEDDKTTRVLLKRSLNKTDKTLEIHEAWDKSSITNSINEEVYECIILDYFLPDTNAIKTMEYFKSLKISTPIIILSAQNNDVMAALMIKLGAFDYISKNLISDKNFAEKILNAINNAISNHQKEYSQKKSLIALQLSEERYRGLIENSPILIVRFFYDDLLINFVNDGFCKYFDKARFEVIGEIFYSLIPKSSIPQMKSIINKIDFEHPLATIEISTKSIYGKQWQIWTFQGIFDKSNKIIELQCMGEDITDQKISEIKLADTLNDIQQLKQQQDGDYFLTSLLLDSLTTKKFVSENIDIDYFIKSKKTFSFRNKNKEIGGDLCITDEIHLKKRRYGVFLNADAMGKSMQGAGGSMVLGAIMQAAIYKAKVSPTVQDLYPETWIKNSYLEFQTIFEQFQGSMLMSIVFGLIDDETGLIYYINAEHPWCVIYKNNKTIFIENELELWKLGIQLKKKTIRIKTLLLNNGETFIAGSDGRDDILLKSKENSRIINDDENLFINIVNEADGDIKKMYEITEKYGEITDDYSLLSIKTKKNLIHKNNKKEKNTQIKELLKNKEFLKCENLLKEYIINFANDNNFIYYYSYVLLKLGKTTQAIQEASRIILRDPNNVIFLIHKAKIHINMNKTELATPIIQQIHKLDPNNSYLKNLNIKLNIEKILKLESKYPICYVEQYKDI